MSERHGVKLGKLSNFCRNNFAGVCLIALAYTLSAALWGTDLIVISAALDSIFYTVLIYFALRIECSYSLVREKLREDRLAVLAWGAFILTLFASGLFYSLPDIFEGHIPDLLLNAGGVISFLMMVGFFILASRRTGSKLAWLAGDKMGGRATFLRWLQLVYWPLTARYLLLHTREPKRPISDHP